MARPLVEELFFCGFPYLVMLVMKTVEWIHPEGVAPKRIVTPEERLEEIEGVHGVKAKVSRVGGGGAPGPAPQAPLPNPVVHAPLLLITEIR